MRVNNYNAVPELRNKIVHPDPDKSFTRYKFHEILKKERRRGDIGKGYKSVFAIKFSY